MTVLLSLLVACSTPAPTEAPAPSAGREVHVLVNGDGYVPAAIDAQPGEALTLLFERPDAANCGDVVVFPATGARHELPVGQTVAVEVTAPDDGRLAFTCGMSMYEGAIVVHGG